MHRYLGKTYYKAGRVLMPRDKSIHPNSSIPKINPKKQLIVSPPQTTKKCIEYAPLFWENLLLSRKSIHAAGSNTGFGAEPQRGVGGAEPPHCKTFWLFTYQVQLLRSHHVYDIYKVNAYTPVLVVSYFHAVITYPTSAFEASR